MKKMAQQIEFFLCDHCAAVHIGLFRNGRMFAEAIPVEPRNVLADFAAAVDESDRRKVSGGARAH